MAWGQSSPIRSTGWFMFSNSLISTGTEIGRGSDFFVCVWV